VLSQVDTVNILSYSHSFYFFLDDFFLSLFVAEVGTVAGSGSSFSACPVDLMCSNNLLRDVNVCRHLWHDKQSAGSLALAAPALTWHQYRHDHSASITNNKLAPYGTDGRLFTTDVSANFKITW